MTLREMVSLIFDFSNILRKLISECYAFLDIELEVIEPGGEDTTIDNKEVITNDCQSDNNQQNDDHFTETVSDTDDQIIALPMENQNEISSTEDDSPLVEDIILQSKNPNKGFFSSEN